MEYKRSPILVGKLIVCRVERCRCGGCRERGEPEADVRRGWKGLDGDASGLDDGPRELFDKELSGAGLDLCAVAADLDFAPGVERVEEVPSAREGDARTAHKARGMG